MTDRIAIGLIGVGCEHAVVEAVAHAIAVFVAARVERRAGIQYGGHIQNGRVDRMSGMSSILRIHPERACPRSQRAD